MTNTEQLSNSKNKNFNMFINAIKSFMYSQGFYSRLYRDINEMDKDQFDNLKEVLKKQKFNDTLDVVFWLES